MTTTTLPDGFDPAMHPANETPELPDFFGGVSETKKWFFPGQTMQFIEFVVMNEGQRKKYQRKISRDIKVNQKDKTAAIGVDMAGDREALLIEVVRDWYIINRETGQPVPFSNNGAGGVFAQWMNRANPRLIDSLEIAVRDANPWMQDEMDPESIREEITRLEALEAEAIRRREETANL